MRKLLILAIGMILPVLADRAVGQEAGKEAYVAKKAGEYKTLADVPPVEYIRAKIPEAKKPEAKGEYQEVWEPDTLDLAERARLFIDNYLNQITIPRLGYEPYDRSAFDQVPPRIFLSVGAYQCALPKYRESLPLLRMMSGSQKGLEIDRAWAENILRCIGDDGIYYIPMKGRPWEQAGAYDWWKNVNSNYFTTLSLCDGRLLGALAIYYQMTGDETWNKTAKGVVDGLNKLAIKVDDEAFFSKFVWIPGEKLSQKEIDEAIRTRHDASTSESEKNTPLWQTWIITGLSQYYRVSHYEPARDLAVRLATFMRKAKYIEEFKSHFHCMSLGMHALTELSLATGDMQWAREAQQAYEMVKSGKKMNALPELGYFVNGQGSGAIVMEGCTIADMTAIATKLALLGLGDQYWEDVDLYARNMLSEAQFTNAGQVDSFTRHLQEQKKATEKPVLYNHMADDLTHKLVGAWQLHFKPNNMFAVTYFDPCCTGNCTRAIYYVWSNILAHKDGELIVRLLLNRASAWADIQSYIPYTGRVEIKVKQPLKSMRVRMNDWIQKDKVICRIGESEQPCKFDGNYLVLGALEPGAVVKLEFPLEERVKTLETFGLKFEAVFRGNECVDLNPKGEDYPMFQRAHYRTGIPSFRKVKQFVCTNTVEH